MITVDFSQEEMNAIYEAFDDLIQVYLDSPHSQKVERIRTAFEFALKAHGKTRRKSGEPYIHHPIAVARIVCKEMGLGSTSICSALLHDVIEDTDYTKEDIANIFGDKVAEIVDGLTKIKGDKLIGYEKSLQVENFRKLIFTMNDDPRVVLIKIADRLHNMRTLGSMRPDKQKKIAGETLEFFAPLAHRLGFYNIKSELEKLSFYYDQPELYQELTDKLAIYEDGVEEFFYKFIAPIEARLKRSNLKFEIKYRLKNVYSINQKMKRKHITFEEMADIFAVRIIFDTDNLEDEIPTCRQIQAYVEQVYKTRPDRVRDWLTITRTNGYQALHVTVMLPDGQQVEVQIRSRRMHDIAEKGVAAHWHYKESNKGTEDQILDELLRQIRDILENPDTGAMEILSEFKSSLYTDDIFVFTPKGEMFRFPKGATVLDLAYAIHSELGNECCGAKIDHKTLPVNHVLELGDKVEILSTDDNSHCEAKWLDMVVTPKAKALIKTELRSLEKTHKQEGKEIFEAILERFGIDPEGNSLMDHLLNFYHLKTQGDLYLSIALGDINPEEDIKKIEKAVASDGHRLGIKEIVNYIINTKKEAPEEIESQDTIDRTKTYAIKERNNEVDYVLAPCCNPILDDEIMGVVSKRNKILVHRSSCEKAMKSKSTEGNRLVTVTWGEHNQKRFLAKIFIGGVDANALLLTITQIITQQMEIPMRAVNMKSNNGIFEAFFEVEVLNLEELNKLCALLRETDNIISAKRID